MCSGFLIVHRICSLKLSGFNFRAGRSRSALMSDDTIITPINRSLSQIVDERAHYDALTAAVIDRSLSLLGSDQITGVSDLSKNLVKHNASRLNWFQGC